MSTPQTKECRLCHRIGYRGYFPSGDYGWVCTRDDLCLKRVAQRERRASVPAAPQRDSKHQQRALP